MPRPGQHWWSTVVATRKGKQSWRCANCGTIMVHVGDLASMDYAADWEMVDGTTLHVKLHGTRPPCPAPDKRPAKPKSGLSRLKGLL